VLDILWNETKTIDRKVKSNFSNQIDILKFIKGYSKANSKEFYFEIERKKNYVGIILECFHPICTPVTGYCLYLVDEYMKRGDNYLHVLDSLNADGKQAN
jgi:hypothetical protein